VWAAGSGMETASVCLLDSIVFWLWRANASRPSGWDWCAGWQSGPPGCADFVGPGCFCAGSDPRRLESRPARGGLGRGRVRGRVDPLFAVQSLDRGTWWPNTFYAKQAEYAITLQQPLLSRLGRLAGLPLIGAGLLLLPGAVYAVWQGWKRRQWVVLAAALWWAGYTVIYALALPVDYQHGRYLIPAMPVFFVLGWVGTVGLLGA